ncbi:MAG: hypothetical protein R6U40_03585 [Desulfobacterales bacterium]
MKNSGHILLATHAYPDGDAIGSLIAMGLCLDGLNKKTALYNESPIPAVYRFLPATNRVIRNIKNENYDLAVILDSIEISDNGKLSMMTLTQDMFHETHTQAEDGDGLINYAKRIQDIKVAALILEHGNSQKKLNASNRFHISLRSNGSVDVAAIEI